MNISPAPFIIFEQHWDETPKKVLQQLIPSLARDGYDTFCLEAPHDLSEEEIIGQLECSIRADSKIQSQAEGYLQGKIMPDEPLSELDLDTLYDLLREHVASKYYAEVAEKIKGLPAAKQLRTLFTIIKSQGMQIHGIDITGSQYSKVTKTKLDTRWIEIENSEEQRLKTFVDNLVALQRSRRAIVFLCGVSHAQGLLAKLKERNLDDQPHYYLPAAPANYKMMSDFYNSAVNNATLLTHTHVLTGDWSCQNFANWALEQVRTKNARKEIADNSHACLLTTLFKVQFRAFQGSDYYVKAVAEITPEITSGLDVAAMVQRLQAASIQSREIMLNGRTYLVIPEVNKTEVATRLKAMAFFS